MRGIRPRARFAVDPRHPLALLLLVTLAAVLIAGLATALRPASPPPPPAAGIALPVSSGISGLADPALYRAIDEAFAKGMFAVTGAAGGGSLTARNPYHGFDLNFDSSGPRITSRGEAAAPWSLRLALRGFGYEGAVQPVQDAGPVASVNRVEYRRGLLTEWYVNGRMGLEQGFTISAPPVHRRRHA